MAPERRPPLERSARNPPAGSPPGAAQALGEQHRAGPRRRAATRGPRPAGSCGGKPPVWTLPSVWTSRRSQPLEVRPAGPDQGRGSRERAWIWPPSGHCEPVNGDGQGHRDPGAHRYRRARSRHDTSPGIWPLILPHGSRGPKDIQSAPDVHRSRSVPNVSGCGRRTTTGDEQPQLRESARVRSKVEFGAGQPPTASSGTRQFPPGRSADRRLVSIPETARRAVLDPPSVRIPGHAPHDRTPSVPGHRARAPTPPGSRFQGEDACLTTH